MRNFALLASLALVFVGFAGCFSGGNGGDAPKPEATNAAMAPAGNLTVDDGTAPMNASIGSMPHMHDYWQGKERVTLMDEDIKSDPFNTLGFTFFDAIRGTPGVGGAFVSLPDGATVYEGTGKLEFTASWTDPTVTGMGLSYRSAADEQYKPSQPLTQGTALSVDVTPEMCDMPHEKDSRWSFLLMPSQDGQAIAGTFHVKVDIVRMHDLEAFPGHPQLFSGGHTITLFSGAAQSTQSSGPSQFVKFVTTQGAQQPAGVQSAKVVPMETKSMTANVTIKSATASIGKVSNITFLYKPAGSSFGFERAQMLSGNLDSGVFQFGIPVDMKQTDSPYAKASQWRFDLRVSTDPSGDAGVFGGNCRGCSDAQVDYDLEAVAYDALLDGIDPPVTQNN
jgi:hypothetical protein